MIKVYKNEALLENVEGHSISSDAWQKLVQSPDEYKFVYEDNKLSFVDEEFGNINFDIDSMLNYHKVFFYKHSLHEQPLAKALGLKKGKEKPAVIDASGGTLKDAMLIYSFGIENLVIFERNPLVAVLIENALATSTLANQITFHFGHVSSKSLIGKEAVIYFDPMYEQKNLKSAPRKGMQLFRKHVGVDLDAKECAQELLLLTKRLVIKRSSKAMPLLEGASMSFGKKSTMYDVYLNH